MPTFDLICLANSRKQGGRCVAGLRTDGGGWIRPVSGLEDGTLLPAHTMINGREPEFYNVIRIGFSGPEPKEHHPENWKIDGTPWKLVSQWATQQQVDKAFAGYCYDGSHLKELIYGNYDFVWYKWCVQGRTNCSLQIVILPSIELFLTTNFRGKPQVRGKFLIGSGAKSKEYNLSVTDPFWEQQIIAKGNQKLTSDCLATFSLTEPFEGKCYKIIAAIYPQHRS